MTEELDTLEAALREAASGAWLDDIQRCVNDYIDCVERRLDGGPITGEHLRVLASRTQALLEWTGAMVTMARERQAAELARLRSVGSYGGRSATPRHSSTA